MAIDEKISSMTPATTPLAGTEILPIVTSGSNYEVSIANITAGRTVSASALSLSSADLTFASTGQKIIADLTNATRASRLNFQTSSPNSSSGIGIITTGSGTTSSLFTYAGSDPDNAPYAQFHAANDHVGINSSKSGTGTTQILAFQIDGTTKAAVDTSGVLRAYSSLSVGSGYTGVTPPVNGAVIQGQVAIGTSSTSRALTVNGTVQSAYFVSNARFNDATSGVFIYQNGTLSNGVVRESGSNTWALGYAGSEVSGVVDILKWTTTNVNIPGLTASQAVVTDGSKNLTSLSYTSAATASTITSRDSNGNTSFNNIGLSVTNNAPTGTTTYTLTSASTSAQYVSTGQTVTFKLPNATTLAPWQTYYFYWVAGSSCTIQNTGAGSVMPVAGGAAGVCIVSLVDNSTANGVWSVIGPMTPNSPVWTSFGVFGSTPNSTGLSVSGRTVTMQPANELYGGGVSTTTQNFAGNKTFTGAVNAATLTGVLGTDSSIQNARFLNPVNAQTGTTYTLTAADCGKLVTLSNASAITLTLPQQSTTTTSAGFWCMVRNLGAGTVTVVKEGAETLDGNTTIAQYAEMRVERPTTTKWATFGGTSLYPWSIEAARVPSVPVASATYVLVAKSKSAFTITGFVQQATSLGTAGTYTININGSPVTGLSAVTNTTAITETSATAANSVAVGDQVTIVFSGSIASPVGWVGALSILQTWY